MEESLNIYQKLAKVRKLCEVIQKNKTGYGYKYLSIDEILAKVTAGMEKYRLSLIPMIMQDTVSVTPYTYKKTKTSKDGKIYEENVNEILVSGAINFIWINNEDPSETITVPWFMTGSQSDPSQAMGSSLTYSTRYFLSEYFSIAQPETDPDNWRSKQREAEEAEDKTLAEQIIKTFDSLIKDYLASNPSDSEKIKKFVTKYVKSGNYFAITESVLAAKLLSEFKSTFIKEE